VTTRRLGGLLLTLMAVVGTMTVSAGAGASSGADGSSVARWTIRDLGTLGGKQSDAADVNSRGQIVGWAEIKMRTPYGDGIRHAVLWQNGKTIDLGARYLPGTSSQASRINVRS
jgi:probable HAF family extracellular repeat protein